MSKEQVNHPSHYCQHPAGIECIDVIRHYVCDIANAIKYLWRAGLKAELGKDDADKEIEDLHKALWYINDYVINCQDETEATAPRKKFRQLVSGTTDYTISQICKGYEDNVAKAMELLLCVGLIKDGVSIRVKYWENFLDSATTCIQKRILAIEKQLLSHEIDETLDVLHGVSHKIKPACKRDTEPTDYDPKNLIIVDGEVYGLSDEVKKKDNGGIYNPCELCYFSDVCVSKDGDEPVKMLCLNLHNAYDHQYYRSIGRADYRPLDGSIVVVDEHKELEAEMREPEEES